MAGGARLPRRQQCVDPIENLALLATHGELSASAAGADAAVWKQALAARKHLTGTRRAQLGAVLATISSIARPASLESRDLR